MENSPGRRYIQLIKAAQKDFKNVAGLNPICDLLSKCLVTDEFHGDVRFKVWMDLSLQDFKPLVGGPTQKSLWISNAIKEDEGVYTCVCTWTHNSRAYQSSGSRRISRGEAAVSASRNRNVLFEGEMFSKKDTMVNKALFSTLNTQNTRHLTWKWPYFKMVSWNRPCCCQGNVLGFVKCLHKIGWVVMTQKYSLY